MSPVFRDVVSFVEGVRARLLRAFGRAAAVWGGAGLLLIALFAWLLVPATGWRSGSAIPLVLDLLALALAGAGAYALRRARAEWLAERPVAHSIEEATGLGAGKLYGSIELARTLPVGVSSDLAEAAATGVMGHLRGSEPRAGGALADVIARWTRRGSAAVALLSPLLIVLAVLTPERSRSALEGLANPLETLRVPALPPLGVSEGREVLRGADVPIEAIAPLRDSVTVHWRSRGDIPRSATVPVTNDSGAFTLRDVRAETEYWATAPDGARTDVETLVPVDPLLVSDVSVQLTFPAHTGRFPEEYRGGVPPLDVPVGTRIRIEGRASRPLAAARLVDEAGTEVPLDVSDEGFGAEWRPVRSGLYAWEFEGMDGELPELAPEPIEVPLTDDQGPSIAILVPGHDTVMAADYRQPLVMESEDDFGVDRIELVVYRVSALGERGDPVVQALDVGGSRIALVRPVMDLSGWNLLSGDTIRYFARAVDNAPTPNVSVTPEYALRPPSRADLRREAQERMDAAADELERLSEAAEDQAEEMRDLERQAAGESEERSEPRSRGLDRAEFEEQEDVRQAMEDQEELLNRVDSLESELDALQSDMEDLADPELDRDLDELQSLLDEMSPDDLKRRLEEMSENLGEMERSEMEDAFQELAADQEAMRDRMEEALERFRRAAMEQEFRATAEEADALAQQQEALAQAMEEGENPELRAEQQEALEYRAEDLESRLEDLQRRLEEAGEMESRDAAERAQQVSEQARQAMKQAQQQAQQGRMQEAAQSAQEASEKLDEMAEQLQRSQQEMNDQMTEALEQALRQASTDALALARQQSRVREEIRGASQETLAALRGEEAAILEGVQNMAENMSVMNRVTQNQGRELSEQTGRAMQAVERTIQALEDQRGRTPSPFSAAEAAIEALNQVAMTAMQSIEQMGQGDEGQGEQMTEQLEQMAQQQSQLNDQTGQIMPMQLGEQAAQQQMQEISEGQQQISDQLGDMAQEPGADGQSLGDLEALAQEAQELAEMLAGGRLDAQVRDRQDRLFHRLLDAGRSLEKEEESEERESEEPGDFERGTVLPLSADDLEAFRYRLPSAAELGGLSAAERQMVLQYFERLNRERARRGGGAGGGR